jgi:hypothetical protein
MKPSRPPKRVGAGDRRDELRRGASCCEAAQQPRPSSAGHQPPARGGAATVIRISKLVAWLIIDRHWSTWAAAQVEIEAFGIALHQGAERLWRLSLARENHGSEIGEPSLHRTPGDSLRHPRGYLTSTA